MHWSNVFAARAAELGKARPELAAAVEPLLKAREAVERQIADLDRKVAASHRRISRYVFDGLLVGRYAKARSHRLLSALASMARTLCRAALRELGQIEAHYLK